MKNFVASFGQFLNESHSDGVSTVRVDDFEFTMGGKDYICSADVAVTSEYTPSQREEGHGFHELGDYHSIEDFKIVGLELAVAMEDDYIETNNPADIKDAIMFLEQDDAFMSAVEDNFEPADEYQDDDYLEDEDF